jgi:polyphosphate kinase
MNVMPKRKKHSLNGQEVAPVPKDANLFLNRELALLAFFWRVLEEAQDETNPLLERLKFLAIVGSILAEFFMTRVSALKQQIEAGFIERSIDGLTPNEQLALVRDNAQRLMNESRKCLYELLPQLERAGIFICNYDELNAEQLEYAAEYYERVVFPVLTPLAYDPARPFPHISNMSLNLAVIVRGPRGQERFARVKVPNTLPRLVPVPPPPNAPPKSQCFVWMDQLIAAHLESLFPGMEIVQAHPFRVTRDAEYVIQELEADDLLETIERGVRQRRFGEVVRLTISPTMPEPIRAILVDNLKLEPEDIYVLEPPLGMSDLFGFYSMVDRADLKYPSFIPHYPRILADTDDTFVAVRQRDILLHHPYDSFVPVIEFLQEAARDPHVLAIKMTLYRVGKNAPVVQALLDAVRNGKQVTVLVELKARFDEESNIEWAKQLEAEGVHVVYGLLGLKTHSKIALVVRDEGDEIRRYLHLSTGNYNAVTAQQYTDIGLLTCDEEMGADASDLFNYLTGYSAKTDYRKFLVAPINLRARLEELVEREIEHARRGEPAHIIMKMNALVDKEMIELFYKASGAGVKLDLMVRGMCCLRPGLPGVSENIRVTSLVGRFLEHSRIYYFRNGGAEQVFLGSADVRSRNLDRRVEILFPIQDPRLVRHIRDEILQIYLTDNVKTRHMQPDGSYTRRALAAGQERISAQEWLIAYRGKHPIL